LSFFFKHYVILYCVWLNTDHFYCVVLFYWTLVVYWCALALPNRCIWVDTFYLKTVRDPANVLVVILWSTSFLLVEYRMMDKCKKVSALTLEYVWYRAFSFNPYVFIKAPHQVKVPCRPYLWLYIAASFLTVPCPRLIQDFCLQMYCFARDSCFLKALHGEMCHDHFI
jgi:hypothetical protein